VLHRTSFER